MFYSEKNYQDMVGQVNLPREFLSSALYNVFREQIIKDLPRSGFIETKNGNFLDFIFHWVSIFEHTTYTQGDMNGDVFSSMINLNALSLEKFIKHSGLAEDEVVMEYMPNKKTLTYSYFDDEKVLCGVSIAYYLNDSSAWTATIIRNTTASPQSRKVVVFCHEFMLDIAEDSADYKRTDFVSGKKKFFDFLHCKEIEKILNPCFAKKGLLNFDKLQKAIDNKSTRLEPEIEEFLTDLKNGDEFANTVYGRNYLEEREPDFDNKSFLQSIFCCFLSWKKQPVFEEIEADEYPLEENKLEEIDNIIESLNSPVNSLNAVSIIIEKMDEHEAKPVEKREEDFDSESENSPAKPNI